ncbi:hypothetical protein FNF28_03669 [Cafeteria roenbergensis]|uniref:Uncharacterized protein n=1 Tax=Cafeteria roenbergensis TaxID=33653 RepID=A0A5A8DHH7_CAFRO|nr:hypothetical protein FNF28_03669 [Cafeteria roenbergensis]
MADLDPRDVPFSLMRWGRPVPVGEGAAFAADDKDDAETRRETLLRALLGGREFVDSRGRLWHQDPDTRHATRQAAADADSALSASLALFQARERPVCPVREQLFSQAFDEVIREEAVVSPERSLLLLRVRDQYRLSLAAYGAVAMGGVEFGQATRGRVAADAAAAAEASVPLGRGAAPGRDGLIVERITRPSSAAAGSAGPVSLTEPEEDESDSASGDGLAEPAPVASGGVTPFAGRTAARTAGGSGGADGSGRASGGPTPAPFSMPKPAAHADDMPVAAGATSEGDDPTLEAAVRRLAREVRALQVRVQEGRLTVRAAVEADQRRSAAEEAGRMRAADELRKQNALLASVVEQARASLADMDGALPDDGHGAGAGALGAADAAAGGDAAVFAQAEAE